MKCKDKINFNGSNINSGGDIPLNDTNISIDSITSQIDSITSQIEYYNNAIKFHLKARQDNNQKLECYQVLHRHAILNNCSIIKSLKSQLKSNLNNNIKKAILTMGIPGSGKRFWYNGN